MSLSGTGVQNQRWNLHTSHDAQRVEANTQRHSALTNILRSTGNVSAQHLRVVKPNRAH
jgi:DNA-binding TFAR19-related protein (PDSD5 family)